MTIGCSVYGERGEILWHTWLPSDQIPIQPDNIVVGTADAATEYILDRTIVPRPACLAVMEGTTISNVPIPASIVINGRAYACADALVTLTLPAGEYEIRVVSWPYLDGIFTVRI
jgi:hypothetical protein